MADASLEDFFAKKDKKKSKSKKFTTTGEIARKLEETDKKLEKVSKKKIERADEGDNDESTPKIESQTNEGEWREFEEETEKDYSDLKIQKLQITVEEDREDVEEAELDEDGEPVKQKEGFSGPWNKNSVQSIPQATQEVCEVPIPEPVQEPTKSTGYVPPHRRGLGATPASSSGRKTVGGKTKSPPDISSEVMFPSLDTASTPETNTTWGRRQQTQERGFESVRHGSTMSQDVRAAGPKLNLGNKFDALSMSETS